MNTKPFKIMDDGIVYSYEDSVESGKATIAKARADAQEEILQARADLENAELALVAIDQWKVEAV